MATAMTPVDDALAFIDALRDRLDAIEFERLAQGLPANPWRFMSLEFFRLSARNMESRLDNDGMTALTCLRFDAFVRELDSYGIANDEQRPHEPDGRQTREQWLENQLRRTRDRLRQAERDLLQANRLLYRHTDDEVLAALRDVDDGRTKASRVADHLWGGKAPHHFTIRVGHALGRLRDAGKVTGSRSAVDPSAAYEWAVADAC